MIVYLERLITEAQREGRYLTAEFLRSIQGDLKRLDPLRQELGEAHDKLRQLEARVAELEEQVTAKEEDRLLARQKLDCAHHNNNALRATIAEMESERKPWTQCET